MSVLKKETREYPKATEKNGNLRIRPKIVTAMPHRASAFFAQGLGATAVELPQFSSRPAAQGVKRLRHPPIVLRGESGWVAISFVPGGTGSGCWRQPTVGNGWAIVGRSGGTSEGKGETPGQGARGAVRVGSSSFEGLTMNEGGVGDKSPIEQSGDESPQSMAWRTGPPPRHRAGGEFWCRTRRERRGCRGLKICRYRPYRAGEIFL